MDTKRLIAELEFDSADPQVLVDWAVGQLLRGRDSRSLALLAGLMDPDRDEAEGLFRTSIGELGIATPGQSELRRYLVSCVAKDILQGQLDPREGCRRIHEVHVRAGRPMSEDESRMSNLFDSLQDPAHYGMTVRELRQEIVDTAALLDSRAGDGVSGHPN